MQKMSRSNRRRNELIAKCDELMAHLQAEFVPGQTVQVVELNGAQVPYPLLMHETCAAIKSGIDKLSNADVARYMGRLLIMQASLGGDGRLS